VRLYIVSGAFQMILVSVRFTTSECDPAQAHDTYMACAVTQVMYSYSPTHAGTRATLPSSMQIGRTGPKFKPLLAQSSTRSDE
jgi:hypothetical protein